AALKGGITFILDMPNNSTPTFSPKALEDKFELSEKAVCDIGFHYGTNGKNTETFVQVSNNPRVFGLKLYCNHTTGDYLIEDSNLLQTVFSSWRCEKPILVHAEGEKLALVIELAKKYQQRLHVCHITLASEVEMVRKAKQNKQSISAGVTPHHLFLLDKDVEKLKGYAMMKPPLGSKLDQDALWQGLQDGTIDLVETDHAPHTKQEKSGEKPIFGVPGLESALGLLMKAAHEGRISIEQVKQFLYEKPKQLFNIPDQQNTFIELDPEVPYILGADGYETKCGWSPFDGWELYGKVMAVTLKNKRIVENGKKV
ncbi:hypothetical protein C4579_00310, partial [Candidatus Microgenomates bacterium]